MDSLIEQVKQSLLAELSEWIGFDIPEEGEEDHVTWQLRLQLIDDIGSIEDACE